MSRTILTSRMNDSPLVDCSVMQNVLSFDITVTCALITYFIILRCLTLESAQPCSLTSFWWPLMQTDSFCCFPVVSTSHWLTNSLKGKSWFVDTDNLPTFRDVSKTYRNYNSSQNIPHNFTVAQEYEILFL